MQQGFGLDPLPNNLLGIAISDDEDATASEAEEKEAVQEITRPPMQREGEADMSFEFEHRPTARTTSSLFYDIPDDSEDD
ncbi:hypothetical protein N0V88_007252 [Collariella sp. IMI 366227]|nr:hypothetical protein N0V88_007252 [Collariella sp. IMI 366227]